MEQNLKTNKEKELAWLSDLPIDDLDAARLLSHKWDPLSDPPLENTDIDRERVKAVSVTKHGKHTNRTYRKWHKTH